TSVAVVAWCIAVITWSVAVIAGSIAVVGLRAIDVVRPPPAARPIAHVAHALAQREIARRGGEIGDGHRRCRRRHDAAEHRASDQTDPESFHGTPPYCCCKFVKQAPRCQSVRLFGLPDKVGAARPRLTPCIGWKLLPGPGAR